MRVFVGLLILGLLAACANESGAPPLPNDQVTARFSPGGVVNAIEVEAINRLPLRSAELVAPDGEATPASYLNVNPEPSASYYQRLMNGPYSGNGLAVGSIALGVPLPADIGGAPQGRISLLAMVSTASIPLPD